MHETYFGFSLLEGREGGASGATPIGRWRRRQENIGLPLRRCHAQHRFPRSVLAKRSRP